MMKENKQSDQKAALWERQSVDNKQTTNKKSTFIQHHARHPAGNKHSITA
jgi:hypothetical protein